MPEPITVTVNGRSVAVRAGVTVAAAMMISGTHCRESVLGEPRSPLCGMGICFECRAVIDGITSEGGKARFVAADLSDPVQLDDLVAHAGTVDVLVNNAGFAWFGPTKDLDVATFDRLFAANVRAAYFLVAALAPDMAARGTGSIINIASMAGQIGLAGGAAYGATKATLASMTRSWAAEFSPSGVRVNAIAAGPVLTAGATRERIEALGNTTLLSRPAEPGEIAEVIAYLASYKASYITGAVIAADGGRTAI